MKISPLGVVLLASSCGAYNGGFKVVAIGDRASYVLDKERSSAIVREGSLTLRVASMIPDVARITAHYEAKIFMYGWKKGDTNFLIPKTFLEPEWHAALREKKRVVEPQIATFDYIKTQPVTMPDGRIWFDCDLVKVTNLDAAKKRGIEGLDIFYLRPPQGIPVLGLLRIDAHGEIKGTSVSVGFDYQG